MRSNSSKNKVYFIKDLTTGKVKIGKSSNPTSRLKTLQIGSSSELQIKKTIPGGIYLEQIIHKYFRHLRVKGEWFKPDYEMKSFLSGRRITISSVLDVCGKKLSKHELKYVKNLEKKRLYL